MKEKQVQVSIHKSAHVGFKTGVLPSLAKQMLHDIKPALSKQGPLSVSVAFVSDKEIQSVNKQYRGKDQPTDVLSFSFLTEEAYPAGGEVGELLISVPTLKRQAKEHGHDAETEARILFVHGLLHILGYDHEQKNDLKMMLAMEQKYLGDNAGLIGRSHTE